MMSWIAIARLTESSVGVVIASSYALVWSELQLSKIAYTACSVVRMSLKSISCACSDRPDVALGVFVADCIPALVADPRTGAFAAVHAGWRGTLAGVLPAAVVALAQHYGARPADLRVALGPAIGPCCFEVGPEVVEAFEAGLPGAGAAGVVVAEGGGVKPRIDLKLANRLLLERAGVAPEAIDAGDECTSSDRARFYSFRRDRGETGQHLGFIGRS